MTNDNDAALLNKALDYAVVIDVLTDSEADHLYTRLVGLMNDWG